MPKSYKSIDKTSSKYRPCLRCFHCKTQTFRDMEKLKYFCDRQEVSYRLPWRRRLIKDGAVQLYWCTRTPTAQPRIFREIDKPFISECKYFNEEDLDEIT